MPTDLILYAYEVGYERAWRDAPLYPLPAEIPKGGPVPKALKAGYADGRWDKVSCNAWRTSYEPPGRPSRT